MVMVIVLGATAAHGEQPMHGHGNAIEIADPTPSSTAHSDLSSEQDDPAFHCGAAMLGLAVTPLQQGCSWGDRFGAFGTRTLPGLSIPLDPRPPRA